MIWQKKEKRFSGKFQQTLQTTGNMYVLIKNFGFAEPQPSGTIVYLFKF